MKTAADLTNALVAEHDLYGGFWIEKLTAIIAAGKREGAEEMREACAEIAESGLLSPATAIRALPLPGDENPLIQHKRDADECLQQMDNFVSKRLKELGDDHDQT